MLALAGTLRQKPQEIYFFLLERVASLLEETVLSVLKTEAVVFSHLIYSNSLKTGFKVNASTETKGALKQLLGETNCFKIRQRQQTILQLSVNLGARNISGP